jgi:dipeptidyl aminopeptidase/acylaminoacyl peptidase
MRATTFVDGRQPPILLLQGDEDDAVKRTNLVQLENAIREKGGYIQDIIYPNTGHIGILGDFTWLGNSDAQIRRDIMQFIQAIDAGRVRQAP